MKKHQRQPPGEALYYDFQLPACNLPLIYNFTLGLAAHGLVDPSEPSQGTIYGRRICGQYLAAPSFTDLAP